MFSFLRGSRAMSYVAVAVVAALAAGGGWALGASRSGVIHACANKRTGALRLARKCKRRREGAVVWNTQGPRGLTGQPGPKGQTGAQGQAGANGATLGLNDFNDGPVNVPSNGIDNTVATLPNVPAGSYIITAKLVYLQASTGSAVCDLRAGGDFDEDNIELTASTFANFPFTLSHTFASPGPVRLTCVGAGQKISMAKISAVQVQTLTRTSG
jgi:hypothetical protein